MKAIINLKYSDKVTASIRYFSDEKKVVKKLDGLNFGVFVGKPKDIAELILAEHHDVTACHAARTFMISAQTPKNATAAQLKEIDDGLTQAFFDFKKEMGGIPMVAWIHANTRTRHLHGILPNSDGRRGLNLGPKQLSHLQDFFGHGPSHLDGDKASAKLSPSIPTPKSCLCVIWRKGWLLCLLAQIWRAL